MGITFWHDDVIRWKHFPRYWPFLRDIHRSPVKSPHKGQWRGALMFFLNGRLSKHSWGWWLEAPSNPLWRHSNGMIVIPGFSVPHSDQCHNSRFFFPESEFAGKQWHLMIRWNGFHWRQSQRRNCWYCFHPKTRNDLAEVSHGTRCHLVCWNWNRCDRIWRLWNESWRFLQDS